jgi:hypothetical protein
MIVTGVTPYNSGTVCDSGAVTLWINEDYRRTIRADAIDSIAIDIGGGRAYLNLRNGETIDVVFYIDRITEGLKDPFAEFNEFCWAVEALIDGTKS